MISAREHFPCQYDRRGRIIGGILTRISIPGMCTEIETSSISRIDGCPCRNFKIINVVSRVKVPFHYFRELDTIICAIFRLLNDVSSILKTLFLRCAWMWMGWTSKEVEDTYSIITPLTQPLKQIICLPFFVS